MTIEHSQSPLGERHAIANWEVTSTAARDALSVTGADIGKVCRVLGVGHYTLATVSPTTWEPISPDTATPALAAHIAAADPHGDRAYSVQRSNHTGTQLAATISDFGAAVIAAAPVTTVFGRGGAVVAASGDYTVSQITGAAPLADPAFTGNVGMPTRTQGDNSAYGASTAYVDTAVAAAIVGVVKDRGNWDASTNVFPSTGGSGAAGAIKKGDLWYISVAGTLGGTAVNIGDNIRALVDAPGQTAGNWAQIEHNIGYVPFNASNVDTDYSFSANSNSKVPSQAAVKWYSDFPKSGTWRMLDSTDTTKKLALDLSAISTATTRTITVPNASVSLGYVPTGFAVSGGIATMTGASGSYTLSFSVYDPAAIVTSSGINLVAGRVYQCSADTSSYTINLPAAPADGDWVVIKDTPPPKNSRIGSGVGIITLNGGTKNVEGPDLVSVATSVQITGSNVHGCERFTYLYGYSSSANTWYFVNLTPNTQYLSPYARVLANPFLGVPGAYTAIMNYATANRTLSLPDYNIDLVSYNTIPAINTANGNTKPAGVNAGIVAGGSHKANKSNQVVLCGAVINTDGLCPEESAMYGCRSITYSSARITGYFGPLKGASTGTAAASLVTGSNTKVPAYLTKPTGHHAVSIFECLLSHTTSAGKVWYGKRRVCVRWDGTTASLDTQTTGTDWNPDTQTITFTPTVSSGLLDISMANTTAAGGDTCYWQCTYEAHHNGG